MRLLRKFSSVSEHNYNIFCIFAPNIHLNAHYYGKTYQRNPRIEGRGCLQLRDAIEHMSKEQRAENRRKFEARVAEAKKYINVCI